MYFNHLFHIMFGMYVRTCVYVLHVCMDYLLSFLWTPGRLAAAKALANADPVNKLK